MRWASVVLAFGLVTLATAASTAKETQPEKTEVISDDKKPAAGESNEVPEKNSSQLEVAEPTKSDTAPDLKKEGENKKETTKDQKEEETRNEEEKDTKIEVKPEQDKKVTYRGSKVARIVLKNKEERKFIKSLENRGEIDSWLGNGTAVDVLIFDKSTLCQLNEKSINYEIVIDDVQNAIEEENPQLSEDEWDELVGRKVTSYSPRAALVGGGKYLHYVEKRDGEYCCNSFPAYIRRQTYWKNTKRKTKKRVRRHRLTWQMYHRVNDIHGYLDYLSATYPQMVTVETIGSSVEGRPLKLVKVSSGQPNSPAIWVDAGIHAREWITPASLTYIISQMVEGGDGAKGVDWYFLPVVNPDGYEHAHTRDRLWRKNRASADKGACAGIDLNRNFGYKWGGQGASRQPCRETYAGSGPFSEPETTAINNFVMRHKSQLKGYVSLHSYGQYILYPWGYDRKVPPDYDDLARVGRLMANAIQKTGGQRYTVGSAANTLYPASGGSDDWAKGTAKIRYAYTIELRDTGRHGFVLPAPYIVPTAKDAYAALNILAQEIAKQ